MDPMPLPQITWQDVQQLPDDGNRYEAIEGELYVTPAPSRWHQTIAGELFLRLHELLVKPGHGQLWFAPLGVEFPATGEGVQPDLVFVSSDRRGILAPEGLRGAPYLVIEILSPTTATRDRGIKHRLYERQGVAEYWIVDPEERAVDVWRVGGEPRHERHTDLLPVWVGEASVGEIDLSSVFPTD